MGRLLNMTLMAAMAFGTLYVYNIKHQAGIHTKEITALNQEIQREKERISLLKAEWSVLTQPARLQALVARFKTSFDLQAMAVYQHVAMDSLPDKPVDLTPLTKPKRPLEGFAEGHAAPRATARVQ